MAGGFPITVDGESAQIANAAELVVALDVLQGQHDREVLQQLRDNLPELIGSERGLYDTLKVLAPEDQMFLVTELGADLARVVTDARHLRDIMATLAHHEVEEQLLRGIGAEGLRCMIETAEELAEILEWVYGHCDQLVLELLGPNHLRRLARSGYDLGLILRALDADRQEELIALLGWQAVTALVNDDRDLAHLLRALPTELSERLLDHFEQERLRRIVPDARAWRDLRRFLDAEEERYLADILEVTDCAQ